MRTKFYFLFIFLLSYYFGAVFAQVPKDTIKTLIITEVRLDDAREAYIEITNVGTEPVNLKDFEVGVVGAWTAGYGNVGDDFRLRLPDKVLNPGECFVIAAVYDFNPKMYPIAPDKYQRVMNKKEFWELADIQLHFPEDPNGDPRDSISPKWRLLDLWNGRDCIFIRQFFPDKDSVVVDQVNGIFDPQSGTRPQAGPVDVAGVKNATNECTLIRKFSVKKGNLNFDQARGTDISESEWIPIPHQLGHWEMWRKLFWTVKNHGDYHLTDLTSNHFTIDWNNDTLTIPWGIRNDDDIMDYFNYTPGIAWHYTYNANHEDSAYSSARTGDKLTLYACGNTLETKTFVLKVLPPTDNDNIVIPKYAKNNRGFYRGVDLPFCSVTKNAPGMDTIYDIPYATRIDTLFKYLEKPPQASWEIVFVDGVQRPDLKLGDKLRVTAKNGQVKEYYIKPTKYLPSHDATLSCITWPDIPDDYRGLYGWMGDTIPGFDPGVSDYIIKVPYGINQVPTLYAKTNNINAKLVVNRAENLNDTVIRRTYRFIVTAEDDTTVQVYTVVLEKELLPENIQPWKAEPFFSEYVFQDQWANGFIEICNPGTVPLDLSYYMIVNGYYATPADAIQAASGSDLNSYRNRYRKYIPGRKWASHLPEWEASPAIALPDPNVNPIVQPKDVFVGGQINSTGQSGYPWFASKACDVILDNTRNPWGDTMVAGWASAFHEWGGAHTFLFKIVNDSVRNGLKPANDPNDFELIDVWGMGDNSWWNIGGRPVEQTSTFIRKPHIFFGNPEFKGSFGTNPDDCEWIRRDRNYFIAKGYGWPQDILAIGLDLGKHYMYTYTGFMSTITSPVYYVSEGYSDNEWIKGVKEGTSVNDFLKKIVRYNEYEVLTVKNKNGQILSGDDLLNDGDSLIVVNNEYNNITKYVIHVTPEGLSDNALLTSNVYTINVNGNNGTISGFDYNTTLRTILNNITIPQGATLYIVDNNNTPVPLKVLNFDTVYVDVKASHNIYFEVIAENKENKILYQLQPTPIAELFVLSDVFEVDQDKKIIKFIPEGTSINGLIKNIIVSPGADVKILDKLGNERTSGYLYEDDILRVYKDQNYVDYKLDLINRFPTPQVGFKDVFITSSDVKIYPNPAINYIVIDNVKERSRIQLYNIVGTKVMDIISQSGGTVTLSVSQYERGIYILVIMNDNKVGLIRKLILK